MKKLISILLALAVMLSLTSIAMATNITIEGGAAGSKYAGYRLLNATDGGDGKFAYTVNEKYATVLETVTGKTEQADICAYIGELKGQDVRDFADAVYAEIMAAEIEADCTTENDQFADAAQGYYLIAETAVGNAADTFSLVMLDTKGQESIAVNTKEDKPTVEKLVLEKNDTTNVESWGESADYDFGDTIPYSIVGRVSNKYADYNSYYYSINDTMDKGLTYNRDIKIYVVNGSEKYDVTAEFIIAETTNEESGYANGFKAEANLKEIDEAHEEFKITATTTINVEYTSTLNEYAVAGTEGNKNIVYLEYENNPYNEGDGNPETPDRPGEPDQPGEEPDEPGPGQTEEDVNIVFTFDAIVNKVDKDNNPLEGAGFTLYKWVKTDEAEDWVQIGEEMSGATTFKFESLDAGQYKLSETKVPSGYNECEDIVFEVVGEYDTTTEPATLTALKVLNEAGEDISTGDNATFNATLASGEVSTNVINTTGIEFPETGGIGTTIFYIIGGVLVLAAVVLLITKKRMKTEE